MLFFVLFEDMQIKYIFAFSQNERNDDMAGQVVRANEIWSILTDFVRFHLSSRRLRMERSLAYGILQGFKCIVVH